MRKLTPPDFEPLALFDNCVEELEDGSETDRFKKYRPQMLAANGQFEHEAGNRSWCNLPRAGRGNPSQKIVGELTKGDLKGLYENEFINPKKSARDAYDQIKVAAKGYCPYCGGVGQVYTIDHYMPKAYYPAYSVTPLNLIPACRDCNTGVGASFPRLAEEQTLHPYIDDNHFFNERWIIAEIERTDPIHVKFHVSCPGHWPDIDIARASKHFSDFELARRYSLMVGEELSIIISQRRGMLAFMTPDQYNAHLLDGANASGLAINGWRSALYKALSETDWFCQADFNSAKGHLP